MICPCCGKHKRPPNLDALGTALKPAMELIAVARKPLSEKTVAANVLKWGTGAINVDGCRVEGWKPQVTQGINSNATSFNVARERQISGDSNEGRWPANIILSVPEDEYELKPFTSTEQKRELYRWLSENA